MNQPVSLRKQFWSQSDESLRLVRLGEDHVRPWTVKQWSEPAEHDVTILMTMFRHLAQKNISQENNPLLFTIARSHLQSLLNNDSIKDKELVKFRSFLEAEIKNTSSSISKIFTK